ncbi:UNVERIFIED_CONTAM: Crossover junction endonuclease EME1, partial [Sesamum indicum]
ASKAEGAEMKNYKKEMQKWEMGKHTLKSIVAEIDKKVVELGSIGGHLVTRFAEKGVTYCTMSNPMERTTTVVPEETYV